MGRERTPDPGVIARCISVRIESQKYKTGSDIRNDLIINFPFLQSEEKSIVMS